MMKDDSSLVERARLEFSGCPNKLFELQQVCQLFQTLVFPPTKVGRKCTYFAELVWGFSEVTCENQQTQNITQ